MPIIGSIADDLTGATTIGALLGRSKVRVNVFVDVDAAQHFEGFEQLDAIIISSNSRHLSTKQAYSIVSDATKTLMRNGCSFFQKRIDSTYRGNIGVEIDAMLDCLGNGHVAIVVPAMPQSKRILVGGYSVIDGVALVNTPVAQDLRNPVKENFIPRLLERQTHRKVGLVPLDTVLRGNEAICSKMQCLREDHCEIIVVDAITLEDVESIAQGAISTGWKFITVDPGPFTSKVAFHKSLIGVEEANLPPQKEETGKTILIIAGSSTKVTKRQMEVVCKDPRHLRIIVDPKRLIAGGKIARTEIDTTSESAIHLITGKDQPRALIFETALHGMPLNLEEEEQKRGLSSGSAADRINIGLGEIAKTVIEKVGMQRVAGIYATGGDTMLFICNALGAKCLDVFDYVIPQVDIGMLKGGKYSGMLIVGKGGLTGDENIVCEILNRIFNERARNTM